MAPDAAHAHVPPGLTDEELLAFAEQQRARAAQRREPGPGRNPKAANVHTRRHLAALHALAERGVEVPATVGAEESFTHPGTGGVVVAPDRQDRSRLMYVEPKGAVSDEPGPSIGFVQLSKSGRTVHYRGRRLRRAAGGGNGANYDDLDTGERFWLCGVRNDGEEWAWEGTVVSVDADAQAEYDRILLRRAEEQDA